MTAHPALAAAVRAVLMAVLVADAALAVAWAWVSGPGFGMVAVFGVMAVVAAGAAVGLAALPGKPRQRNGERHE